MGCYNSKTCFGDKRIRTGKSGPMNEEIMDQKIFDEEQKHLTDTYAKLTSMDEELEKSIEELNRTAAEEKADILTNFRFDTADDEVQTESYGEIETWNRYIDTYNIKSGTMSAKLTKLKLLLESPYFARVTLQFAPDEEPEDYYIGRSAISENGYDQLIVDWRSPIAETYYNQDNGKTFYEVDGRRIDVDLLLRRQFELEKDQLKAYFDTQLAIEDPMLLASLSRQHSDKMQAITVTIQKEQNAVIRYPDVPVLLVNGIAGSGKTSVLLQRIAFMFFHQRTTLKPEDVYLITLNPVFRQYIDNVLPDLGERNPNTLTWTEFLQMVHDPIPDPGVETAAESLRTIDRKLPDFTFEKEDLIPIDQKGKKVLDSDKILELLRGHEGKIPAGVRLVQVTMDELLEEAKRALRRKSDPDAEDEEENGEPAGEAGDASLAEGSQALDPKEENRLQNNYGGAFKMIRECGWLDFDHIGQRLLGKKKLTSIEWFYLKMALTGECDRTARYVCIDEVQDYTEAQLMVFERYFINAKFMLLGDEFQSIREGNIAFADIHRMFEEKGKKTVELPLQTSYRSSPEITALFAGLLPEEKKLQAQSVQRPGQEPELLSCSGEEDWKEKLLSAIEENAALPGVTAVICANRKNLEKVQKLLGNKAPMTVNKDDPIPSGGAALISLPYAKGLEFDHVILPDADADTYPEGELSRHRLYTAISRATQNITILSGFSGKAGSPLLKK